MYARSKVDLRSVLILYCIYHPSHQAIKLYCKNSKEQLQNMTTNSYGSALPVFDFPQTVAKATRGAPRRLPLVAR